jgi:hypothetical protein
MKGCHEGHLLVSDCFLRLTMGIYNYYKIIKYHLKYGLFSQVQWLTPGILAT